MNSDTLNNAKALEIICMDDKKAAEYLPKRKKRAHKGEYGSVLLAGGAFSMQGALYMAARSCFGSGCGLTTLYTPQSSAQAIAAKLDTAMIIPAVMDEEGFFDFDADVKLASILKNYNTALIGCGLGKTAGGWNCVKTLLESDLPLVMDADALNLCAMHQADLLRNAPLVITPHLMEFSRLMEISVEQIKADPLCAALPFIEKYPDCILILKSDITRVVSRFGVCVIDNPTSALSKGGSGDLLAGICASFLAQSRKKDLKTIFKAMAAAVWVHNQAAALSKSPYSCTPDEILRHYGDVFARLEDMQKTLEDGI